MIRKFNYSTPGRNDADNKLQTRDSYKKNKSSELIDDIVKELGGINNIESLDACITRLRVTVKDTDIVASDEVWRSLQAKGVIRSGNGVQIIYGTQAEIYKNQILDKYNL
ncbi:PTS glucose/sucrose transporter subunit IIB [Aliivibrio fischeri]|nr:PTS glucose/sucrose transporter subunit IIB [Aliivibrio fischeri]